MSDTTGKKELASFSQYLRDKNLRLKRSEVTTLQVNLGKLCNQACRHCHVDAGPTKTKENMSVETYGQLIRVIKNSPSLKTIDITGGAPELNVNFRELVKFARAKGIEVIDRCNLTVLFEAGQEDTAEFLAQHSVQVVASLPCYSRENVDRQRGNGVFEKSLKALKILNDLGYGKEGTGLKLHLVYNPLGPSLPPDQMTLQQKYKEQLMADFQISFNQLFTITNMPIKRFLDELVRSERLDEYRELLLGSFNVAALDAVMCRSLLSVSWDGRLFDCDFNQMLEIGTRSGLPKSLWDIDSVSTFRESPIAVGDHCFACTAGSGSSCTGALLS